MSAPADQQVDEQRIAEEIERFKRSSPSSLFYIARSRPNADAPTAPSPSRVLEHIEYIRSLQDTGVLFCAGMTIDESGTPLSDSIMIVRAKDADEATRIVGSDPLHRDDIRHFTIERLRVNFGSVNFRVTFPGTAVSFE